MSDDKAEMFAWACITVMVVSICSGLIYYNIVTPSSLAQSYIYKKQTLHYYEKMVKTYNVSPAVLECTSRSWSDLAVYQICKEVLSNHNITREDAQKLVNGLKKREGE